MKPFDQYPDDGYKILPRPVGGANARHGYGMYLQSVTNQTTCAYCDVSLVDEYYHWLLLQTDHVIPRGECNRLGLPSEWQESMSNMVICCSACNQFDNRYRVSFDTAGDWTVAGFFELRDSVFRDRREKILKKHEGERRFFETSPWKRK